MRLHTDLNLRQALYGLYLALFEARKACPQDFHLGRLTTIQTAVMGIEDHGWRVVGITPEALDALAAVDYRKSGLPRQLCRGHLVDRVDTARALFDRRGPVPLRQFFSVFLANDTTVIMLTEQNRERQFPRFIAFANDDASLFPNGSLMGWKHRACERDFLMWLDAMRIAAPAFTPLCSELPYP